ncbi:MOB-like protein phocein [Parambassis ranga]|uniref:MOB-like protein phocein n=1 Tax=Parambassis ranga TaxID=210632 RepID=A0A6P7KM24_9TELE|nr:MOB-like protein phocein [Parambassis ranga]
MRPASECHPDTCTQMTATEQWIFLCAAHKTPKECLAIDYTRHTLDGAACLLNSNKYFPSRVSIKESSVAKLGSVCRRIYRIFSHAYFHHRQIFDKYENETFLCHRFTRFVMKYNLMSKDNLIVPILEEEVQNTSSAGESENECVKAICCFQCKAKLKDICAMIWDFMGNYGLYINLLNEAFCYLVNGGDASPPG